MEKEKRILSKKQLYEAPMRDPAGGFLNGQ